MVHLHAIGNIHGGKPSCSSRVREFRCDPTKVHYFLEIGHENRYTFIRHLPLIQKGFLSVSSESMCKTAIPHRARIPRTESPRIDKYLDSWLKRTQFAKSVVSSCNSLAYWELVTNYLNSSVKTWPRIPGFEKLCLIRNKFLMHSWTL